VTADQLGVLCGRLTLDGDAVRVTPEIRALAESIVERVRAGVPPDELADDFDDLEDELLRAGHAAGLGPVRSPYEGWPGAGDGHRELEVHTCPGGTCARVEVPGARPVPCPVHRRPMALTRLRP
jgi:uncharacterized protein (DUF433 family)